MTTSKGLSKHEQTKTSVYMVYKLISQFTLLECKQASSPRTCLDWFLKCSHLGPAASCVRGLWGPWSHRCLSNEKSEAFSRQEMSSNTSMHNNIPYIWNINFILCGKCFKAPRRPAPAMSKELDECQEFSKSSLHPKTSPNIFGNNASSTSVFTSHRLDFVVFISRPPEASVEGACIECTNQMSGNMGNMG